MAKRLSKGKRMQIIQRWLQGIDDESYEVIPTKTEGKYFVRPRKESNNDIQPNENNNTAPQDSVNEETVDETQEKSVDEQIQHVPLLRTLEEAANKSQLQSKPKRVANKVTTQPLGREYFLRALGGSEERSLERQQYDPTINLEILNQLKSLGEELKASREEKKQKKLIKQTVREQMYKQRRVNLIPHQLEGEDEESQLNQNIVQSPQQNLAQPFGRENMERQQPQPQPEIASVIQPPIMRRRRLDLRREH